MDFLLIALLGFLGSFGHCLGMCGPLTAAFTLSAADRSWQSRLWFNLWLNLGRILSYGIIGAGIGAIGSVLIAGGQMAGIGSGMRRGLAIATGLMLIWFGLVQIAPSWLRQVPLLHPLMAGPAHDRLQKLFARLAQASPFLLGLLWGLIPCGFLYAAQLRAAATGDILQGAGMMVSFGLGTFPMMLGVGTVTTLLSRDRRSQLFRLGGWVTLAIGILTLCRTSEMVDYTGHASLFLLMLALVARPIQRLWSVPLQYRRAIGVGAFILALAHVTHTVQHSLNWNPSAIAFLLPHQQGGMIAGIVATVLMTPAALTSFDICVRSLGRYWRWLHLLAVPALILAVTHSCCIGSSYLGILTPTTGHWLRIVGLISLASLVLALRSRWLWVGLGQAQWYQPAQRSIGNE